MFWWFERAGAYARYEVVEIPGGGGYQLRFVLPDGSECVEHFNDSSRLAERQQVLEDNLKAAGWTGPHGRLA